MLIVGPVREIGGLGSQHSKRAYRDDIRRFNEWARWPPNYQTLVEEYLQRSGQRKDIPSLYLPAAWAGIRCISANHSPYLERREHEHTSSHESTSLFTRNERERERARASSVTPCESSGRGTSKPISLNLWSRRLRSSQGPHPRALRSILYHLCIYI